MKVRQILEARTMVDDRPEWILDPEKLKQNITVWKRVIRDEIWHRWMVEQDYGEKTEELLEIFIQNLFDAPPIQIQDLFDKIPHESVKQQYQDAFESVVEQFHHDASDDIDFEKYDG